MPSGTNVTALRFLADTCVSVADEIETIHREQKVTAERSGREEESSRDKTCADQFTFHTCSLLAQPLGQELCRPCRTLWGRAGMCWGAMEGCTVVLSAVPPSPAPRLGGALLASCSCSMATQPEKSFGYGQIPLWTSATSFSGVTQGINKT